MNITDLKTYLENHKTEEILLLDNKNINDECLKAIAEFMLTNKTVKTLSLSGNKLENIDHFSGNLKNNKTLKTLCLNNN